MPRGRPRKIHPVPSLDQSTKVESAQPQYPLSRRGPGRPISNTGRTAAAAGITIQSVIAAKKRGKSDEQIVEEATTRSSASYSEAVLRDKEAVAQLREIELKEKLGEVVNAQAAAEAWHEAGAKIRDELMAIPDRVALKLEHKTMRVIRTELMMEIRRVLASLSDAVQVAAEQN